MKCQYCGAEIAANQQVCTVCGAPVDSAAAYNQVQGGSNPINLDKGNQFQNNGQFYNQPVNGAEVPPVVPIPNSFGGQQVNNGQQYDVYGQQPVQNAYGQQGYPAPQAITKKQFIELPALATVKKHWKWAWLTGYICGGFTLLLALFLGEPSVILDVLLVVGFSLGIQLKYSRGCAIALLAYSVFNLIYSLISTGRAAGILIVFAGVWAVRAMNELNKHWKNYQSTGMVPNFIDYK